MVSRGGRKLIGNGDRAGAATVATVVAAAPVADDAAAAAADAAAAATTNDTRCGRVWPNYCPGCHCLRAMVRIGSGMMRWRRMWQVCGMMGMVGGGGRKLLLMVVTGRLMAAGCLQGGSGAATASVTASRFLHRRRPAIVWRLGSDTETR